MTFSPSIKKYFWAKISFLFISLLAIPYFILSATSPKSDERLFLENVMIRNGGLYVLMGSKPMIDFPIESGFPETDEECVNHYSEYLSGLKQLNEPLQAMNYHDYLSNCKSAHHLHHRKLWNAWTQKMGNCLGPYYRFLSIDFRGRETGFFINIPNLLSTLKTYYQEFSEINGGPFDIEQVVDQITDQNSLFWTKLFKSSYSIGLLLGYGKKNAYLFYCQRDDRKLAFPQFVDLERKLTAASKKVLNIKDLPLPEFCTFCLGDEVMENYKQQRLQIIKELKGKDFEATVKHWLATGKQSQHELREIH